MKTDYEIQYKILKLLTNRNKKVIKHNLIKP